MSNWGRLLGIPLVLVGLCLLWFNRPMAAMSMRYRLGAPQWARQNKPLLVMGRVIVVIVGAAWIFFGIGLLAGFLH